MSTEINAAIDETSEQMVVFHLANEYYGVDIGAVNTIIRIQEVTNIPRTPEFIDGVINLRGSIIPVINLRKRFGLQLGDVTKASRIVVVEASGQLIGMIVDAVAETIRLPQSAIEPPSPIITSVDAEYLRGVGKLENRLVILLDLGKVLSESDLSALDKTSAGEIAKAA